MAALKLLEMQRHSLLMYTSCGWFFADISGMKSLQVIKYAARALQLGQDFTAEPLEAPFLKILERAVSNIPKEGNGLTIYQKRIKPAVVDYPKVANQWVISWLKDRERQCPHHIYHYRAEPMDLEEKTQGSLAVRRRTFAPDFGHHPRRAGPWPFSPPFWAAISTAPRCRPILRPRSFSPCGRSSSGSWSQAPEDLIPLMVRRLGETYYSIHDIFQEEKLQVFQDLLRPNQEEAMESDCP